MAMMNYGGGGQSQMMSMSMSSVSLVACLAIAGGAWYVMSNSNKNKNDGERPSAYYSGGDMGSSAPMNSQIPITNAPGTGGTVTDGNYNIKYGGINMMTEYKNCNSSRVGFGDSVENDQQVWNFKAVSNRPGYYRISSEHNAFDGGCDLKYLTAPVNCEGSPLLDKPNWADRQYWKLEASGDGKFMLRNAACADKRQKSYLTSSGVRTGWNTSNMTSTGGSPYSLNAWTSA